MIYLQYDFLQRKFKIIFGKVLKQKNLVRWFDIRVIYKSQLYLYILVINNKYFKMLYIIVIRNQ